jgi:heptosyltransferase-2
MGFKWLEQDYMIPKIKSLEEYDIGLNFDVHPEWKSKKWPMEYWQELNNLLSKDFKVSFQRGLNNFEEYLKWLASCRIIVTCETFGLHLASALRKKTIALVGPLENSEYPYGRIELITPQKRKCMPCNQKECNYGKSCIEEITPEQVKSKVMDII